MSIPSGAVRASWSNAIAATSTSGRLAASLLTLVAALVVIAGVTACATVGPLERHLLVSETARPTAKGARGPLTHAQVEAVLKRMKARSPETEILDRHVAVEEEIAGAPLALGNFAQPLEDGKAAYAEMMRAIKGAKHHVHMEMYIFEADEVGSEFAAALAERARAGVQVRLIYDSVGSMKTPREFFQALERDGVQVAEFNPVTPGKVLTDLVGVQARDHRKLIVADGRVAILGGINISRVYGSSGGSRPAPSAKPGEEPPWRDMQIKLQGPVVADFQRAFVAQWARWKKERLPEAGLFPKVPEAGPHLVRAVASSPQGEGGVDTLYLALISAIESAETEVCITNAYFVPHPTLVEALNAAARRGVDVKLMLPGKTDNMLVFHAGRAHYRELLEAGVKIYQRKERLLHTKSAVIDGVWSVVGSTNLDWRSLAYNDELNAIVLGPEFAARMKAIFEKDVANAELITPATWSDRSVIDRIKEAGATAISRLL